MTIAGDPKRKASFDRKPKPDDSAPETKHSEGMPVQFGPTKSPPGSRQKGGK